MKNSIANGQISIAEIVTAANYEEDTNNMIAAHNLEVLAEETEEEEEFGAEEEFEEEPLQEEEFEEEGEPEEEEEEEEGEGEEEEEW